MDYLLKHDDIDVCLLTLDDNYRVINIKSVENDEHLPPYIKYSNNKNSNDYNEWLASRTISNKREGLNKILDKFKVKNARELLIKNYALSLYDHYWICPLKKESKWKDINFFENSFSSYIGDILIGDFTENREDMFSPECTSGGNLPKKWEWRDGKTYLLKRGSSYFNQEPFNEVIASTLMKLLEIPCVAYTIEEKNNVPRCCCKNMLDGNTELIHSYDLMRDTIDERKDKYVQFLEISKNAGIDTIQKQIDQMLVLDYIIANTDRHLNNIGFIRDSKSLEFYGLAPIYDSGNSLWYDLHDSNEINKVNDADSKPFKGKHSDQIKKVKDLSWFDSAKIKNAGNIIHDVFKRNRKIDLEREYAIINKVEHRIEKICTM